MLGLQSCGNMEFLLNHVSHRDRVPQRQRSAEETVQQRKFLVLPVEICLERFHGGLRSTPRVGINVSGGDWVLSRQDQGREIWECIVSARLGRAARAMSPVGTFRTGSLWSAMSDHQAKSGHDLTASLLPEMTDRRALFVSVRRSQIKRWSVTAASRTNSAMAS